MKSPTVVAAKKKVDLVFSQSSALLTEIDKHSIDLEMQAHLAKYLCIVVSAFIESSIRAILVEYARNKAAPTIVRYVEDQLKFFYNAKAGRVLELMSQFNAQWRLKLEGEIDDELKDALDTVVENKNKIAHGKDSQITFVGIRAYYARILKLLDLLEQHCC